MSQWTHITGTVRVDYFQLKNYPKEPEFFTWDGDEDENYSYEESLKIIEKCNVPEGSEGSLSVSKMDTYRSKNQSMVTYTFAGDLRDYGQENIKDFETWLFSAFDLNSIRQGIFEVDIEYGDTIIYQVQFLDEPKWVRI